LIPVHPRSPTVSIAECLHILRDKASAWSSFELKVTKRLHRVSLFQAGITSIIHQQLAFSSLRWPNELDLKVIAPRTYTPADEETSNQPHWSLHVWNWHEGGDQLGVGVSLCLPFRDLNSNIKRTYVYSAKATLYSRSVFLPRRSF